MRYTIRELKLGEILDQAVKLTKDHFGILLGITAVLLIPFYAISGLVPRLSGQRRWCSL
jgi:hypothetical protein